MDHAQYRIAILDCVYYDPHGKQIIDLIKRLVLGLHFSINTVEMLRPTINCGLNAKLSSLFLDLPFNLFNIGFPLPAPNSNLINQIIVLLRVQVAKANILQLSLHRRNTEPMRQRCVYLQRFSGLLQLLFRWHILKCIHVMLPICQFNEDNPYVLSHCHKHFSKVLSLLLFLCGIWNLVKLCNPIHQFSRINTELLFHLIKGIVGILNSIMQ